MSIPLENYNTLISLYPEIERKGKTTPYTSMNGHMFSFLSKEGEMGLRLSKDDIASFMEEHPSEIMMQHGRVMKEYVKIQATLLKNTEVLFVYFKKSVNYVAALKPKPSKLKE